ncbi:MAG: methyl-accepting chemotaxis protein [Bryobacterales bacterium]|nr:methyl-accepting chemotaxis protein [Bryobacterales bacterium]
MQELVQEIIREFLVESHENLARLDQELVELEKQPRDAALLASIFRTIHTIKGTRGFLGFATLEAITHKAETLLSQLRDGERLTERLGKQLKRLSVYAGATIIGDGTGRERDGGPNYLAGKKKAMACAAEFGKGNFKAMLEKFPGKRAFINKTIEQIRGSLVEMLSESAQSAAALASSCEELTAVSQQMAGNAEETAVQANAVPAASEQVSKNVSSVAPTSKQMQASIGEIAKNTNESARVAKNPVSVAHSTNFTVTRLRESSQEVGNAIKAIASIAQQANIQMLNGTIEAAPVGEAGKGFAVVANEVKEQARQTAKATEDISQKIEAIQVDTKGAVKAIEEIGTIISQINDISDSIASAVEERTATANEIGRSVAKAAKGVGDIAKNIGGVAMAAKDTANGASDTQKASQELSPIAARLQAGISRFTV